MKTLKRNDKNNQRQLMQARYEARQVIQELHDLLARPSRLGLSVGEMVNVAASMGLLKKSKNAG